MLTATATEQTYEWMRTPEVGRRLGLTSETVRKRLIRGEWPGIRLGRDWLMRREVVNGLAAQQAGGVNLRLPPGRPRKRPRGAVS